MWEGELGFNLIITAAGVGLEVGEMSPPGTEGQVS